MTYNSNTWQNIWEVYNRVYENVRQACEDLRRLMQSLIEAFSRVAERFKEIVHSLEDLLPMEDISCDNYTSPRRYYYCQPQLIKVNTKGYSHNHMPVTRRYI